MSGRGGQTSAREIARAAARVLEEGSVAALVTVVEAPGAAGAPGAFVRVGAKVLLEETGARTGSTGDAAVDESLSAYAPAFLDSRAEARTLTLEEVAPGEETQRGGRVLFERVEAEPRVVVCGAGHVGAALARLAHEVGYGVTLLDDR